MPDVSITVPQQPEISVAVVNQTVGLRINYGPASAGFVHNNLNGRAATDAHPTSAISGLDGMLTTLANNIAAKVSKAGDTMTGALALPSLHFDVAGSTAHSEGDLHWNPTDHTLDLHTDIANSTLQLGQENWIRVVNKTGATILDGTAVYINDAQGNRPTIEKADTSDTSIVADRTIGVVTADIANNAEGYVTTLGIIRDFNTSGFTDGAPLYVDPSNPGAITDVEPTAPDYVVRIGYALNSTVNGSIFVAPVFQSWKQRHGATHGAAGSDPVTLAQSQITGLTSDLAAKQPLDTTLTALAGTAFGANGEILISTGTDFAWSGASLTYIANQLAGSGGSAPVPQASTAWALSGGVGRFGTKIVVDGTAAGSITTAGGVTATGGLYVNGTSGAIKSFCQIQRGGVTAWFLSVRDATDDLRFRAYDDAGVAIDYPLTIARAAGGAITLTRPLTATSIAMAGALTGVTTINASSTITCTVNVDSFPVFYSAVNNSTGANAGSGFSFSTGDSSGYVGCFSGSYAAATLADRVILGANSAASNGAGVYIPTAGQSFDIIGNGGVVTARFPTAGGAVFGTSGGFVGSERVRIAGGSVARPGRGASDVCIGAGAIHSGNQIVSANYIRCAATGSDSAAIGPFIGVVDSETTPTVSGIFQLSASGHTDFYSYASSTWTRRLRVQSNDGAVIVGTDPGGSEKVRVGGSLRASGLAMPSGGSVAINGVQVLGARGAAVADATGGTTVDAEARAAINDLLARMRAHGVIAT